MIDSYSDRLRVAVPSEAPGGLDSARSGHFGRSPYFTLVDIVGEGEVRAAPEVPGAGRIETAGRLGRDGDAETV